jgi:hypothetical protein
MSKELEESWVHFGIHNADEVIKEYGVKFFVDNLDRENIIALCAYFRKIQHENNLRTRDS